MQVSWIDAHQVTALAESLRGTPTARTAPLHETFPHGLMADLLPPIETQDEPMPEPETFEAPLPPLPPTSVEPDLQDFRSRLKAIREKAIQAGLMPNLAPVVAVKDDEEEEEEFALPPFEPFAGAVSDRLAAFAFWARPALGNAELFIVGDQGDLVWGQRQQSGLVLSAILAWGASSRMSALAACEASATLRQRLATGAHLTALPCSTRLGIMHIAITGSAPVPDRHLPALREALMAAMEAQP